MVRRRRRRQERCCTRVDARPRRAATHQARAGAASRTVPCTRQASKACTCLREPLVDALGVEDVATVARHAPHHLARLERFVADEALGGCGVQSVARAGDVTHLDCCLDCCLATRASDAGPGAAAGAAAGTLGIAVAGAATGVAGVAGVDAAGRAVFVAGTAAGVNIGTAGAAGAGVARVAAGAADAVRINIGARINLGAGSGRNGYDGGLRETHGTLQPLRLHRVVQLAQHGVIVGRNVPVLHIA